MGIKNGGRGGEGGGCAAAFKCTCIAHSAGVPGFYDGSSLGSGLCPGLEGVDGGKQGGR